MPHNKHSGHGGESYHAHGLLSCDAPNLILLLQKVEYPGSIENKRAKGARERRKKQKNRKKTQKIKGILVLLKRADTAEHNAP